MMWRLDFTTLLLVIFVTLFSCSKKEKDEKTNAEIEYTNAYKALQEKDYSKAAEGFEKIDDNYPFSKWAAKGKTMAVYARYKNSELDKSLAIIDDFTTLNPTSEYVPYMLYMRGLSYYEQIPSIERAQENTRQASFTFRELIARYPYSDYATDARTRLDFIDEHLAGYNMALGRYQIRQENYIGAIPNFHEVVERYRASKQVPEALFRLGEIYQKIGIRDEAEKCKMELSARYPGNYWAQEVKGLGPRAKKAEVVQKMAKVRPVKTKIAYKMKGTKNNKVKKTKYKLSSE